MVFRDDIALHYRFRFGNQHFPVWSFNMEAMEFYGRVNLLKGAIVAANAVTTVSPRYAQEIQTYESTRELSGVIYKQRRKLSGILNGIDTRYWNPETDPHIPERYSNIAKLLNEKISNKQFSIQYQDLVNNSVNKSRH